MNEITAASAGVAAPSVVVPVDGSSSGADSPEAATCERTTVDLGLLYLIAACRIDTRVPRRQARRPERRWQSALPRRALVCLGVAVHTAGAFIRATISYNTRTHAIFHVNLSAYGDVGLLSGGNGEEIRSKRRMQASVLLA